MKHSLWVAAVAALAAVGLAILGFWPDADGQPLPQKAVALILDTDIGVNSAVIGQGAQMAAREYGAALTVEAPSSSEGSERQIDLIQEQLEDGVSGILLVPAQADVVNRVARLCERSGAKLVLLDNCEAYRGVTSYVGTDHMSSGIRAAEKLLEITGAKRFMVLCQDDEVSRDRLIGVEMATTRAKAQLVVGRIPTISGKPCSIAVLQMLKQNPGIEAVLCLDGALTECAAKQISTLDPEDRVPLAGFDCDQTHIACLEDGSVLFTVLREPLTVGYEGFKRLMETMALEVTTPIQYVDVRVVPRQDILKPENVRLVFPLIQ